MAGKKIKTIATLLCINLIFSSSVFPQFCQETKEMKKSCCCCGENSSEISWFDFGQKESCGCQLNEGPKTENQPAIFTSYQDGKSEQTLWVSNIEFPSQGLTGQHSNIYQERIYFPLKGPPLYILNSSFII